MSPKRGVQEKRAADAQEARRRCYRLVSLPRPCALRNPAVRLYARGGLEVVVKRRGPFAVAIVRSLGGGPPAR
jgi:hypothetical protein